MNSRGISLPLLVVIIGLLALVIGAVVLFENKTHIFQKLLQSKNTKALRNYPKINALVGTVEITCVYLKQVACNRSEHRSTSPANPIV